MRRALTGLLIVLAVFAPTARADVLVPADPPARAAQSVSAAGDVVVYNRGQTSAAFAAGAPVAVPGASATAAAADDGTAAIASVTGTGVAVQIRRAGTAFAPAISLRGKAFSPAVAAARGGWVAVAWLSESGDGVEAAVIDPRGLVHHATLQSDAAEEFDSPPRVGIDATGRATVAWSHWHLPRLGLGDQQQRVRVARSDPSGTWTKAATVAAGAAPLDEQPDWPIVSLTVTPSGHSLLAWATLDAIQASEDGARSRTLTAAQDPGSPAASLADDGAAVVAYSEDHGLGEQTVSAVDRAGGGAWTAPHELGFSSRLFPDTIGDPNHIPTDIAVAAAVGEDGRAVVAFDADAPDAADETQGVVAATGTAGGAWSPLRFISLPPARVTPPPVLTLDAAGAPWAVWVESGGAFEESGTVRGARLVAGAQAPAPDATPPQLQARIPSTVSLKGFRVRVRCAEACTAGIALNVPDVDVTEIRVRVLPAGRAMTITVRPGRFDARIWRERHARRLRIRVRVSDRAGNVSTATRSARITSG